MPEKTDGYIEIKGGVVTVYNPVDDGSPVVIGPDPLAVIKINDQVLDVKQAVSSSDKVEIFPVEEEIPATITVELSDDKLQATVTITPRVVIKRKVKDTLASQELVLEYEEEKTEFPDIKVEDVYAALKEKGVVFGVDPEAVDKAVREFSGSPQVVARGKEVVEGKDGYVELFFDPGIKISSYDEESLKKVDYKEKIIIPSVKEGDLLAVIHPPVPGVPGCLVTGEPLEPKPVREAQVNCKEGCMLSEDGDKVLATSAGRPLAEGKYHETLRVLQVHIHNGDVDVKSGNLRFGGELKITGDILEGMVVESLGNLEVMGHTAGAQVTVGGSAIFHNNLINTRVTAGVLKSFYQKIYPHLCEMEKFLVSLKEGLHQLEDTLSSRGKKIDNMQMSYLLKLLVERKFITLPELAENMLAILKETKFSPPSFMANAIKEVGGAFKDLTHIQSGEQFAHIVEAIKKATAYTEHAQEIQGDIIATYVQNSTLECSGNITVRGMGSYNSFFNAGGDIRIEGVFRGGEIKAEGDIYIGEAGSPGLILKQGNIYLAPDSIARFRKVYENVKIFFGKRGFQFKETRTLVKVQYAVEEDMIKVINI